MKNLEKTEEQILIRPEDYESYVESEGLSECYAVQPYSLDALFDAAEELGMTSEFYGDGVCAIADSEYPDVVTMLYYGSNIDGKEQWVIDWFEINEDSYGSGVWKVARKLKLKIVQDFWIWYHIQQFPGCDLDLGKKPAFGEGTDEFNQQLEVIWDTYYGDFEYERELKAIERIYEQVKTVNHLS